MEWVKITETDIDYTSIANHSISIGNYILKVNHVINTFSHIMNRLQNELYEHVTMICTDMSELLIVVKCDTFI